MAIEIRRYIETLKGEWDEFVENVSINGTFLHTRKFYDHNPLNEKEDCSFLFYKKDKLIAVIPCLLQKKGDIKILNSYSRATYGGFVISEKIGVQEAVEIVELLVTQARQLQFNEIIIRNPFKIFYAELSDETDYAMWFHGFEIKSRELEIYIPLTGNMDTIKKKYENGTKYNTGKANKFIEVKEVFEYDQFWKILSTNLLEKHGRGPVHSLEQFKYLLNFVGKNIKLFGGFLNDKLICGSVIFIYRHSLHAQYIGQDNNYQEYRAMNAVIDFIITWGNKNGYKYFNLGTANENDGKIINAGLFHFKESFGGRGVLRETMHLAIN